MENEDIIDFLFNKQEDEDTFNLKDNLLNELNTKIENYSDKISLIINKKVHPKNKLILEKLIRKSEIAKDKYHYRENQLYYKNGVVDGVNLMVTLLSFKW